MEILEYKNHLETLYFLNDEKSKFLVKIKNKTETTYSVLIKDLNTDSLPLIHYDIERNIKGRILKFKIRTHIDEKDILNILNPVLSKMFYPDYLYIEDNAFYNGEVYFKGNGDSTDKVHTIEHQGKTIVIPQDYIGNDAKLYKVLNTDGLYVQQNDTDYTVVDIDNDILTPISKGEIKGDDITYIGIFKTIIKVNNRAEKVEIINGYDYSITNGLEHVIVYLPETSNVVIINYRKNWVIYNDKNREDYNKMIVTLEDLQRLEMELDMIRRNLSATEKRYNELKESFNM